MPKKATKARRDRAKRRIQERTDTNQSSRSQEIKQANPVRRSCNKTQLDILFGRAAIDQRMKMAGDRFCRDWHRSGSQPQLCSAVWTSTGIGKGEMTEQQVCAYHAFRDAIRSVGLILSPVLIDVCLWDVPAGDWAHNANKPRADGPAVLRMALEALVYHYTEARAGEAIAA